MKTTTIKNTDLHVSMFCLGGQSFGSRDDKTVSYAMLDQFVEGGGNFLDTANNYAIWNGEGGESETMLGNWLADRGNRDRMVLATKMGGRTKDAPMSSKPEHIRRECERSLKRLRTDRIDLYYFHCDDRSVPLGDQLGAMDELVRGREGAPRRCKQLPRLAAGGSRRGERGQQHHCILLRAAALHVSAAAGGCGFWIPEIHQ